MNSEEYLTALFGEANPVSDAAAFASAISARLEPREQWSETMTDTNLKIAEEQPRARNHRGWLVGAVAAIVIVILGAGTFVVFNDDKTTTPASGESDIVGEWFSTDFGEGTRLTPMRLVFEADGTYVADITDLVGGVQILDVGQYELVDGVLTQTTTPSDHGNCDVGQVGIFTVSAASVDEWFMDPISSECDLWARLGSLTLTRSS